MRRLSGFAPGASAAGAAGAIAQRAQAVCQPWSNAGVARIAQAVVQLAGILAQVVELALPVGVLREKEVARRSNRRVGVLAAQVLDQQAAPAAGLRVAGRPQQRDAVHLEAGRDPGEL